MSTSPSDRDPPPQLDPLETFSAATRARFGDEATVWIDGIPGLVADLASRWSLELGDTAASGDHYTVESVRGSDPLDLEVSYPDGWWAETTQALEAWRGDGTLRLFELDHRGARLLERHTPAPPTAEATTALRDACALARRLWLPAPDGITTVAVEVRAWASELQE